MNLLSCTFHGKATRLARAGRYAEAITLLDGLQASERETSKVFDLLARIYAQQGKFEEASAYWKQALKQDPGNMTFTAGLRRIEQIQSRPLWAGAILTLGAVLVAVFIIWFMGLAIRNQIDSLHKSFLDNAAKVVRAAKKEIQISKMAVEVPGVKVRTKGNSLIVHFDEGLFLSMAYLKPEAKTKLSALGRQLKPHASQISVKVIGCTDNKPVPDGWIFRDNIALGMARAIAVIDYLRGKKELPATIFTVQTGGDSYTPYPNDTPENMLRNRTVIIRICPQEEMQGALP
jgi:type VI secretion system protein ImpK